MQEDTKPKNDDVQDKGQKKPLTRSEYHGVITSYAGLALSLIAIVLSVITMYQSHVMETREVVQILRAEDDGYYHFDGETLFKNFQVTVANNSAIPVSVVEITVERDGEARTFEVSDLPDILPLNMEANHTEMITIPWNIELSETNATMIREYMDETESDVILSSKATLTWDDAINAFFKPDDLEHENRYNDFTSTDKSDTTFSPESTHQDRFILYYLWKQQIGSSAPNESQKVLALSIALNTAKNHQYILTTEDTGAPESEQSEGLWVANRVFANQNPRIYEILRGLYLAETEDSTNQEE